MSRTSILSFTKTATVEDVIKWDFETCDNQSHVGETGLLAKCVGLHMAHVLKREHVTIKMQKF